MRKKLLSLPILLLIVLSLLSALNVNMTWVSASASPVIRVADPASPGVPANISGLAVNTVFNVSIYTNYTALSDVWGYEFTLAYNPLVLEIVSPNVTNGDLITGVNLEEFLPGDVDNTEGTLSLTAAHFKGENVTGGPGTLAKVTFNVTAIGDSCLILGPETKLVGIAAGEEYNIIDATTMPGQIQKGYFFNTAIPPTHDLAVTSVTTNATGVLAGEFVEINATVSNDGTVPERFRVDFSYSFWHIGTETVILNNGLSTDVIFIWNTTDVLTGDYTITAKARPVCRETDTADNTGSYDTVFVMSPSVAVTPDSVMDASLTAGSTFTVSIYTDYDGTLISRSDVWGYEFTLTFDGNILEVLSVTNGGNMEITDVWIGDGVKTVFTTTEAPIVSNSEEVYVNQTLKSKPADYSINYATGAITFTSAPGIGGYVEAIYEIDATLMNGANFTAGTPGVGTLSLTSNNVSTTVTGPGVLAVVTFNVTGVGDTDITLGPNSRVIGSGSEKYAITLPNRLKHGFFTNGIDVTPSTITPELTQVYEEWTTPLSIQFWVENRRAMATGPFNVTLSFVNSTGTYLIGNKEVTGGIEPLEDAQVTIDWTTHGRAWGHYNLTVEIIASNDINAANDVLVYSDVTIKMPGDIDGNGTVDPTDVWLFTAYYPSSPTSEPQSDINGDGNCDPTDVWLFTGHYPTITPQY